MRQAQCMEAQTFHILVQDCPKYVDNCAIIETWCRELGGNLVHVMFDMSSEITERIWTLPKFQRVGKS